MIDHAQKQVIEVGSLPHDASLRGTPKMDAHSTMPSHLCTHKEPPCFVVSHSLSLWTPATSDSYRTEIQCTTLRWPSEASTSSASRKDLRLSQRLASCVAEASRASASVLTIVLSGHVLSLHIVVAPFSFISIRPVTLSLSVSIV